MSDTRAENEKFEGSTPHAVAGPDGHAYLALGFGKRGWFPTFALASVAPVVIQQCMQRGPRYGSMWTVKSPLPESCS